VNPLTEVLLIYPFYRRRYERSPFRFPPLGIGYIASFLKQHGFDVKVVDGTFQTEDKVIKEVERSSPRIVGIYSMYSMEKESISLAKRIRHLTDLMVAGGPLPTINPLDFTEDFDVVVIGEAEHTMLDIVKNFLSGREVKGIQGTVCKDGGAVRYGERRQPIVDIDSIPFPARELFDNDSYKEYYTKHFGYTMTSMISSRGCPFKCDFCSKPVFGDTFRSRSPQKIVDEMEYIVSLGYDAIWFADDCFTITKDRVIRICEEITRRGLKVKWQCLSRADTIDLEMATKMKEAGCKRIYFGIEAGDSRILRIMKKGIDLQVAKKAVYAAKSAGMETGAFFIIGYPGESDQTILNTIKFVTSLPLDYVSFTLPYPIPGTGLYEKVKHSLKKPSRRKIRLMDQYLEFNSQFSEFKLKFAITKAAVQFLIRKHLGSAGYTLLGEPFEKITNAIFKALR
jgi:anaerobic magnesium-protoporphyrin IX monomethyl ester cyclase